MALVRDIFSTFLFADYIFNAYESASKKSMMFLALVLILSGFYGTSFSSSGFCANETKLATQNNFQSKFENGRLSVTGTVTITNNGTTYAHEVYPTLKMKDWDWSGAPYDLAPKNKQDWTVSQNFYLSEAGVGRGIYPVYELINIRDSENLATSRASAFQLEVGPLSQAEKEIIQAPAINVSIQEFALTDRVFSSMIAVTNNSNDSIDVATSYFAPRELQILQPTYQSHTSNNNPTYLRLQVNNKSGLTGHDYIVYADSQWEYKGLHLFHQTSQLLSIPVENGSTTYTRLIFVSLLFGITIVALSVWRILKPRKNLEDKL
jgi:hypothetical protein